MGGEIVVRYVSERDHAWLARVLEEHEAHVGHRRIELDRRLSELPVPNSAKPKLRIARVVLDRVAKTAPESPLPPKEARAATFRKKTSWNGTRASLLASVAESFGVTAEALEASLFADLPSERRVCSLGSPTPAALAEEINSALVAGWVSRATSIRIDVWGDARPLVRHVRRAGLLCVVRKRDDGSLTLDISGAAILFRRTAIYARALASIVPRLRLCERFELRALCSLPRSDETALLRLDGSLLGAPSGELRGHDDRVHRRFVNDFDRLGSEWMLGADPPPIEMDGVLVFPDFELRHPGAPERRWLIEIVGFWTPEYLSKKLELLRKARIENLVVCVDAQRDCGAGELSLERRVIRYKGRIDPRGVVEIIDGTDGLARPAAARPAVIPGPGTALLAVDEADGPIPR